MKKLFVIALAIITCLSLAACGGKSSDQSGKQPATADVVEAVASQLTFQDELMTLEDKMVANIYNLDEEKLAEKTVRTSATRATAEEVSVFKVKDAADVGMVQDAINERIEDQKIAYENYVPAEMAKINNAAVYTNGSYVILVMADDTSKVEELFQAQF